MLNFSKYLKLDVICVRFLLHSVTAWFEAALRPHPQMLREKHKPSGSSQAGNVLSQTQPGKQQCWQTPESWAWLDFNCYCPYSVSYVLCFLYF